MKKYLIVCFILVCVSHCWAAKPSFVDVKLGMELKNFNRMRLAEDKIPAQKQVKEKSSQGVFFAPTAIQSKFFKMKDPMWQHGMVKIQNNEILQFSLYAKKVSSEKAHKAFAILSQVFDKSFSAHPFKSFGKSGVSFEWQVENQIYAISYVAERQGLWSYHLDVSPVSDTPVNKSFLALNSTEVTSVFMALGIDQHSSQGHLASKSDPLDDELSSLFE